MPATPYAEAAAPLMLQARTAADLMTSNPVSVPADATIEDATAFLIDRGFSAAPVIDRAGRPVGVISRADILVHDREKVDYLAPRPIVESEEQEEADAGEPIAVEKGGAVRVRDLMTPVVFSVLPSAPVSRVVADMLAWKVHRLFVVDEAGILVGIISTLDILRRLSP